MQTDQRHFETATPVGKDTTGGSLPADLLRDSARRVRSLAHVFIISWSIGLLMNLVVGPALTGRPTSFAWWPMPGLALCIIGLVLSAVVAWLAGRWSARPDRVLDLGLAFEMTTALLLALLSNYELHLGVPGLSTVAAVLLITPSLIPVPLRKRVVVSLIVATLDPLTIAWTVWRGADVGGRTFELLWAVVPTYLAALIGLVPMLIIRRLGRDVKVARELGSYRLGELLGRGGMGEVYRASHRLIARPAAVKLVRPELLARLDPDGARIVQERFRREAEAAASLRSPHTIELYDFGIAGDGTLFYVMEMLDGYDWQSLVETFGPMPPDRAVLLLRQACESLAEAHELGLIHRDIKPSNLFLCRLGVTCDVVKVLDFGLVRRRHLVATDTRLTAPEMPAGTPHYLPPEVVDGQSVDQRADLYSLGCVAYWLLTGRVVFEGGSALQVLLRHVGDAPVAPSRHAPGALPAALDDVILACLAKNPEERPQDAKELSRRLAAAIDTSSWTAAHSEEWWRNHATPRRPSSHQGGGTASVDARVS